MSSPLPGTAPAGPLLPAGNPRIVGIVNITEDSFSDGGRYLDPAAAVAHARNLRAEGADIIELGPAASHPDSAPVSVAEERRRLAPVLEQLAADGIPVSVDSFRPETLRFAVCAGAACLNDIHGFGDPGLYPLLAASQCRLVVMHAVQAAGPATQVVTDPAAVRDGIFRFFARRLAALQAAGIGRDRLVIDPGLGYFLGTTPGLSLAALAGIRELKDTFGVPVLVSPSRKSFLRVLTGRDVTRSGPATLAAEIFAAWQGADYIRTHDVAAARDALTFLAAITREASHAGPAPGHQGRGHHTAAAVATPARGLGLMDGREEVRFRSDVTVELVKHAASDADVLWAARVSTKGKQSLAEVEADPERSEGLINFLMRNRHGTPFEHSSMTFYVRAPIFVFREFMRHRTFSYNEESGRYRRLDPEFYVPGPGRKLVQEGKPGAYEFTDGTPAQRKLVDEAVRKSCRTAYAAYLQMLDAGVAREVARTVLPVGIYSSMYATGNARALMNFLSLRRRSEASAFPSFPQQEIEMVAELMEAEWARLMPLTHAAFERSGRVCP